MVIFLDFIYFYSTYTQLVPFLNLYIFLNFIFVLKLFYWLFVRKIQSIFVSNFDKSRLMVTILFYFELVCGNLILIDFILSLHLHYSLSIFIILIFQAIEFIPSLFILVHTLSVHFTFCFLIYFRFVLTYVGKQFLFLQLLYLYLFMDILELLKVISQGLVLTHLFLKNFIFLSHFIFSELTFIELINLITFFYLFDQSICNFRGFIAQTILLIELQYLHINIHFKIGIRITCVKFLPLNIIIYLVYLTNHLLQLLLRSFRFLIP